MLTSQGKAYLEPLPNALPVRWSRPPDLLLGLAKEAVAHQKKGVVKRRLVREILGKRLAADTESTSDLVGIERRHPLLLPHPPRRSHDGVHTAPPETEPP